MSTDIDPALRADERGRPVSAPALLSGALSRLYAKPAAFAALVFAGVAVTGTDWLRAQSPVPVTEYTRFQTGDVNVAFEILVTVLPRNALPPSALLYLRPRWLLVTVGLELFAFVTVVLSCTYALAAMLETDLSVGIVARYGALLAVLRVGAPRATFTGGSLLVGIPLLVAVLYLIVSLVPVPGRLVLGESLPTALRRSWARTDGYRWSLLGVVLVLGITNDLLAGLPVVSPAGSALVAAVHAGVVATFLARTDGRQPSGRTPDPTGAPAD
jgi:hypothetical protein